ncbi:Fosfomycin resistance protein AbaF [Methylobacterium tardum]|uniref:MFS transporter n=1 Tax=Methylobacterium tardum TaxID=374432 RepID=A0AA37WRQ8_9HYPH|nr:MFS transporter [Methylobacterium tardum]URD38007.1 MHS family MFS transporter [Methylobacterium tardum]GJE50872.1 Fosfomycin resistance protein AbaF [Methylobacterium tardum]GLS70299.1 MFS transporter [Methylobacterium tardum]
MAVTTAAPAAGPGQNQSARAALAAFVGTTIEWYDFFIYGTAAALVFGPLFFTAESPYIATLSAFGTFAVGFLARPLGGLIFGHLGDRFGRKRALVATLVMMGIATSCIGLLPTYASVGLWAPVMLVVLRLIQGLAVGGEWGGAVLMAAEHAPAGRNTFFASFAQLGSPAGQILSLLAFRLAGLLDKESFLTWGWRVPFLVSILLLFVGLAIRLGVAESPAFEKARAAGGPPQAPVREVLTTSLKPVLLAAGANTFAIASVYLFNTFMIAFTTQYLGIARATILDALLIGAVVQLVMTPVGARIAELIRNERLFLQGTLVWAMLAPYPLFWLVETKSVTLIVLGLALNVIGTGTFYAVIAGYLAGAFPTRVRYTAISIAYQFCGALAGGLTPIIGTVLAERFQGHWWPIAVFGSALAGVSFLCVTAISGYRARQRGFLDG